MFALDEELAVFIARNGDAVHDALNLVFFAHPAPVARLRPSWHAPPHFRPSSCDGASPPAMPCGDGHTRRRTRRCVRQGKTEVGVLLGKWPRAKTHLHTKKL